MTVKLLSRERLARAMCDLCIAKAVHGGGRLPDRMSTWEHPTTGQRLCHEHAHPHLAGPVSVSGPSLTWHSLCSDCGDRLRTADPAQAAAWRYQHDLGCILTDSTCTHSRLASLHGVLTCRHCRMQLAYDTRPRR